jgi:hypothetical protein
MKLILPEELRQAVSQGNAPVELQDRQTNRLYYLISADQYEKVKQLVEAEEIDPSFFEFDDEDFDPRAPNHG